MRGWGKAAGNLRACGRRRALGCGMGSDISGCGLPFGFDGDIVTRVKHFLEVPGLRVLGY